MLSLKTFRIEFSILALLLLPLTTKSDLLKNKSILLVFFLTLQWAYS